MAKYQIAHRCGHTIEMQLVGKVADRDRRIAWEESRDCRECERARETAAAAEANAGLPALEGSDKQVAWAETIRARIVGELDGLMDGYRARAEAATAAGKATPNAAAFMAAAEAGVLEIRSQAAAGWWIDNQHATGKGLIDGIFRAALAKAKG